MAVAFEGGVVLGADSRTSTGAYIANRVSDKLTAVHDAIYCCRSGSAADTQAVADFARRFLAEHALEKGAAPSVSAAAKIFRTLCYENKDRLMAGVIVAGFDAAEGGSVYEIPLGGTCVRQQFAVGGSGSSYIYGLVDASFKPNMSREECVAFVRRVIAHAMARDGSSGGVIRTVVIDKNGVERGFLGGDELPFSFQLPLTA
jgi:20S proteasome subunit beta 1